MVSSRTSCSAEEAQTPCHHARTSHLQSMCDGGPIRGMGPVSLLKVKLVAVNRRVNYPGAFQNRSDWRRAGTRPRGGPDVGAGDGRHQPLRFREEGGELLRIVRSREDKSASFRASTRSFFFFPAAIACSMAGCATFTRAPPDPSS